MFTRFSSVSARQPFIQSWTEAAAVPSNFDNCIPFGNNRGGLQIKYVHDSP